MVSTRFQKKAGFTLIELLMVISIIGLLSSVILSSLSTARYQAYNTATMASFRSLKQMEDDYYLSHDTYIPADCTGGHGCYICQDPNDSWNSWPPPGMDPSTPNIFKGGIPTLPKGNCVHYMSGTWGSQRKYFEIVFSLNNISPNSIYDYDRIIKNMFGDYPEYYGNACWEYNARIITCIAMSEGPEPTP